MLQRPPPLRDTNDRACDWLDSMQHQSPELESKHSNDLVKLLRCCESVCIFMTFTVFYYTFFAYSVCLSVGMSLCICVWAMLPDSNKMMTMMMMIDRRIILINIRLLRRPTNKN